VRFTPKITGLFDVAEYTVIMSDKTPRLQPHTRIELARRGSERYTYPTLPLTPDQHRKLGQLPLTDGAPIIRDAPEETTGVGWPE
jgi:hypothetical protein